MECAKIKVRYIQWMVWTELQSKYLRKKSENISSLNDTSYQTNTKNQCRSNISDISYIEDIFLY